MSITWIKIGEKVVKLRAEERKTLKGRQVESKERNEELLALTALVGSVCFIKRSAKLLLLPSCQITLTSYTWDYKKMTCNVYVGAFMCACICQHLNQCE